MLYGARKVERIDVASSLTRIALLVAQFLRARRAEVEGIAVSLSLVSKGLPLYVCMSWFLPLSRNRKAAVSQALQMSLPNSENHSTR
jgi:hypothetical protein